MMKGTRKQAAMPCLIRIEKIFHQKYTSSIEVGFNYSDYLMYF